MNQLPRRKTTKNSKVGIPNLSTLKAEPLTSPFTLKLWPSISRYLEKNGGADFVRSVILEKLQRILDEPAPARCSDCKNLTTQDNKPFCKILLGFLGKKKLLNQKFSCDYFSPRKEAKRGG